MFDLFASVVRSTETAVEATTESSTEQTGIMDVLNLADSTSKLTVYLLDIIYIMIAVVICTALITLLLYIIRLIKNSKNPNYKKNDDDFLDG